MSQVVQLYKYNPEVFTLEKNTEDYFAENFNPFADMNSTHWLNFHSMKNKSAINKLCDKLCIDRLLQEDLFAENKRTRLEEYSDYVFFSIVSALPKEGPNHYDLNKERISFIIGDNYLISFQEKASDHFPEVRERIEYKRGKVRYKGPDFLLFRMLEAIIDNYTEVVEQIALNIEKLDKIVLRNPKSEVLRKVEWEKRKLLDLRKIVFPMKELMGQLDRVENEMIIEDNIHYFRELKDTCFSLIDEIEAQKQMLDGIANLYYAIQGQRMNEVMKVLTVTSAIFIPLTFIVGVYGMNFENMPELKSRNGYYMVWAFMILITAVLVFIFWKRGWLKRNN